MILVECILFGIVGYIGGLFLGKMVNMYLEHKYRSK